MDGHLLKIEFTKPPISLNVDKLSLVIKNLDSWLGKVESLLTSEDSDLVSVQNLMKKHQLVDVDIEAHRDSIQDMNNQADSLVESGQFVSSAIQEKRQSINERFERITTFSLGGETLLGLYK